MAVEKIPLLACVCIVYLCVKTGIKIPNLISGILTVKSKLNVNASPMSMQVSVREFHNIYSTLQIQTHLNQNKLCLNALLLSLEGEIVKNVAVYL